MRQRHPCLSRSQALTARKIPATSSQVRRACGDPVPRIAVIAAAPSKHKATTMSGVVASMTR